MTTWIISANPNMYDHASSFEHYSFIDWHQGQAKFEVGDVVFIYTTAPMSMIQYKCVVIDKNLTYPDIRNDIDYWKDKKNYQKSINGKFMRLVMQDQVYNTNLNLNNLKLNGLTAAPQGPVKVKPQLLNYINTNLSDNYQKELFPELLDDREIYFEGIKRQILVNKYERSSIARKRCLDIYGLNCSICDMNFVNVYGDLGEGFIHIHHLTPIHKIGKEYQIDYEKDLIPVCPNCHAMLHRKIDGIEPTINELRKIVKHYN